MTQIAEDGVIKNQYVYGAFNRLEQAVNAKGDMAKYTYNGLGHRIGTSIGQPQVPSMVSGNPQDLLQQQIMSPETQIRYTVDLTKEYHNLLQKEENSQTQT